MQNCMKYHFLPCRWGEIGQNLSVTLSLLLSISSISSACRQFGTRAKSKRQQWPICTYNGLAAVWAWQLIAQLWLPFRFFSFSPLRYLLCVYTLFYPNPKYLSHLDGNCRSSVCVKEKYGASLTFLYWINRVISQDRHKSALKKKKLQMRDFSVLRSPQVVRVY